MKTTLNFAMVAGIVVLAVAMPAGAADKASNDKSDIRPDAAFVRQAAEDGQAEVAHGKLAQKNASRPDVKEFGQRMVTDHTKAGAELAAVAKKLGMKVPTTMSDKHEAEHKKLAALSGAKFDQEYVTHMIQAHETAVSLFQKEAKNGDAPELKDFASKTLPTVEQHLQAVRALRDEKAK